MGYKIILLSIFIFSCNSTIEKKINKPPVDSFEMLLSHAAHSRDKEIDSLQVLIQKCEIEEKKLSGQKGVDMIEKEEQYRLLVTDYMIAEFDSTEKVK